MSVALTSLSPSRRATKMDCPICRDDEGLIENPDGETLCLECGWTETGVGMSRREMIQAEHGYQDGH